MTRATIRALLVTLAIGVAGGPAGVAAQSLNFSGNEDEPVEIFADNGIEWQQERLVFVARGNARAVRGEVTVFGDELRAYYRDDGKGGTDIWRLDALGHVRIVGPEGKAFGDKAIYDVDNAILVMSGGKLRLVTRTDEITADEQLEYWENKQMAVARGNAYAVRGDKRLRADVLAAYFRKQGEGDSKVYRVDAFDRVQVVTAKDKATSQRGVYNVESGIATLTGSVKITRGSNVLNGCRAVVNLNTGISKLFSCPAGSGRVSGVLQPRSRKDKKSN